MKMSRYRTTAFKHCFRRVHFSIFLLCLFTTTCCWSGLKTSLAVIHHRYSNIWKIPYKLQKTSSSASAMTSAVLFESKLKMFNLRADLKSIENCGRRKRNKPKQLAGVGRRRGRCVSFQGALARRLEREGRAQGDDCKSLQSDVTWHRCRSLWLVRRGDDEAIAKVEPIKYLNCPWCECGRWERSSTLLKIWIRKMLIMLTIKC